MDNKILISGETLDEFSNTLKTASDGIEKQFLHDLVDCNTNIPVNENLHVAFNKRNAVIYRLLTDVQAEITNIEEIRDIFQNEDSSTADSYTSDGN